MGSAAHRKSEYVILQQPFAQPRVGGQYRRKVCASVCQRVPVCAATQESQMSFRKRHGAQRARSPIARVPAGLSLGIGFCSFAYDGTF